VVVVLDAVIVLVVVAEEVVYCAVVKVTSAVDVEVVCVVA
jgi:hypothetical protein